MSKFRPNLAAKTKAGQSYDELIQRMLDKLQPEYVYMSPKMDGIRCCMHPQLGAVSRTLKPIPNLHLRKYVKEHWQFFEGYDGEFCWGSHESPFYKFSKTSSKWMTHDDPDISKMTYYVFDTLEMDVPFEQRWLNYVTQYDAMPEGLRIRPIYQVKVKPTLDAMHEQEEKFLQRHYEGAMIRLPHCLYKQGRSTGLEGGLMAMKRFEDSEAVIIGFEELMHNENEATIDARGYTKRSSHIENKVPAGILGKLVCRPADNCHFFPDTSVEFRIGSGFSSSLRAKIWDDPNKYLGQTITYKFQNIGIKDKPRTGIFKGFRNNGD